jgi:GNAT superfamily N-acetyltransferase
MSLRPIELPQDLILLMDLILDSFKYPENPEWSVQTDEKEQLVRGIKNLRTIWPLIRLIQLLSPQARDILLGYVWEGDDCLAGATIVQRSGSTDTWVVGTVAVHPGYRRQGIARQLVQAGIDLIRSRGGKKAILAVIAKNYPAYSLYESLGFEDYLGRFELQLTPEREYSMMEIPPGYVAEPLGKFEWQPRYELDKRITPQRLQAYDPVEIGAYRQPLLMQGLILLSEFAQGTQGKRFVISTDEGISVAHGGYSIPRRGKGVNILHAFLDPQHPKLAPYLISRLMHQVTTLNPGLRVEIMVPRWMDDLEKAAQASGFELRTEYRLMGLEL